jgi:hypothetical protein
LTTTSSTPVAEPADSSRAQTIRRYLDGHGGDADATVDHLLKTFDVEEDDADGRGRIATALSGAGVGINRPLPFLGADEEVHLSLAGSKVVEDTPKGGGGNGGVQEAARLAAGIAPAPLPEPSTPAGWYPDRSSGRQRYWDGLQWTEHYADPAQPQMVAAPAAYETPYAQAPRRNSSKATWALVLGILGILVLPIVFSILAIVIGVSARSEIDRTPSVISGRGNATAGIVLGIIGLVGWALILIAASGG